MKKYGYKESKLWSNFLEAAIFFATTHGFAPLQVN